MIYGGKVGSVAHDAVRLGWRIVEGAPIALGIFVVYVIVAFGIYLYSKRKLARSRVESDWSCCVPKGASKNLHR